MELNNILIVLLRDAIAMYSHCERDYIASLKNYLFVILRQPETVVCRSVVIGS